MEDFVDANGTSGDERAPSDDNDAAVDEQQWRHVSE